jgi:hypothetical protein
MWPVLAIVACVLGVTAFAISGAWGQSDASAGQGSAGERYSVIETDGELLIVTDNSTNTLYFYTVDEGSEGGSPLHLRGSMDLSQVGEATITPRLAKRD